jgi:hypothetical protein
MHGSKVESVGAGIKPPLEWSEEHRENGEVNPPLQGSEAAQVETCAASIKKEKLLVENPRRQNFLG